jgi:hypothetical protein
MSPALHDGDTFGQHKREETGEQDRWHTHQDEKKLGHSYAVSNIRSNHIYHNRKLEG